MSILQDLDPQNAKLQPTSPDKPAVWRRTMLLAVPILLGALIWLLVLQQRDAQVAATEPPLPAVVAAASPPPSTTPSGQSPIGDPPDGTASIRDAAPANATPTESKTGDNAFLAMREELAKAQTTPVAASPTRSAGAPTAKQASATNKKNKGKAIQAKRSAKRIASNDGSQTARSQKKQSERDIDIITAIVK